MLHFDIFNNNKTLEKKILTLSERMPPYLRHYKYSKKIECREFQEICWFGDKRRLGLIFF